MFLINLIKYALLFIIFLNSKTLNNNSKIDINYNFVKLGKYSLSSFTKNVIKIPEIYFAVTDLNITYSKENNLIEIVYYVTFFDINYYLIKPSNLPLLYNLSIFCNFYYFRGHKNIYSFANIHENKEFYCVEYSKIGEPSKFGISIYKLEETGKKNEFHELFFFTDKLININNNISKLNNYKFNIIYLRKKFNQLLDKYNESFQENDTQKESNNLLFSYMQSPSFLLKRDFAQSTGKWYFKNIYGNYFCFCKGRSCINIITFNKNEFQSCKYYFYLTIIDNNRFLYPKTHYLLSDFFNEDIESSEAFPVFQEMLKRNLNVHYITMSWEIYERFCLNDKICQKELQLIYGIKAINGNILEKFFELFLRLKAVITAEKYDDIDNLFYNVDYITYIFLGHGVTYVKSFLYNNYLNPKRYNKILLTPSEKIFNLALKAGWKEENIIKIGYPKWDNYELHLTNKSPNEYYKKDERAIFMMFTWRQLQIGKKMSNLYYDNIFNILNNSEINNQLYLNNVKLYFCYHHALKEKKIFEINNNTNIRFINQNEISKLLKNSSLIITDFSSILFDAIVQKKPLILFIPDGLETNLKDIYENEYYETITKIKNGNIYLGEVYFDLNEAISKIIYYIKNNFTLENEKLKFFEQFNFKNFGNTNKFIDYIKNLN